MKLRVLGASGGELPGEGGTCLLVDDRLAIDAGALTSRLPFEELRRVDDVLVTHAHLDHVRDIPLLADLVAGRRRRPVVVHASPGAATTLRRHVFNGKLWPDFTRIPSLRRPALRIETFRQGVPFRIGRYAVSPVRMRHAVESTGFVLRRGTAAFAISGDTGPTAAFWREVDRTEGLGALIVEVSFPRRMQRVADRSGHLTPRTLGEQLSRLVPRGIPVYLYHLKPAWRAELVAEVAGLDLHGGKVLESGDTIVL